MAPARGRVSRAAFQTGCVTISVREVPDIPQGDGSVRETNWTGGSRRRDRALLTLRGCALASHRTECRVTEPGTCTWVGYRSAPTKSRRVLDA